MESKTVASSRTETVHILLHQDLNGAHRLFGGRLMEWIDVAAAVAARRHSGCSVTTAAVDDLQFGGPAYINDTLVLSAQLTHAGRTSMEVRVDTFVEGLDGTRTRVNRAYLVMVAVNDEGKPVPVPALVPETEEEKREYAAGEKRREFRTRRRTEGF